MGPAHKPRLTSAILATLAILFITIDSSMLAAQQLDQNTQPHQNSNPYAFPGGVAELWIPKISQNLPTVMFGMSEPVIIDRDQQWQILIGLSLNTLPGEYVVYVKENDAETPAYSLPFNVEHKTNSIIQGEIKFEFLESEINPLSELSYNNTEQPKLPLSLPVAGKWADYFGFLMMDINSNPESGNHQLQDYVSLSTSELSTVEAPSNAIVSRIVFESDNSDNANPLATIFLDHGRGLFSIISGLSDLSVETGNGVVAGAVIGKLPPSNEDLSTLYWRCSMNGVLINPLILTHF